MKPSKYCNILMGGIISGACIDFVFQISGWKAAIAIIVITIATCAANVYSDLEEKKLGQDREERRKKIESDIAESRREALQKILSDLMDLKKVIIEKSDEQTDSIKGSLREGTDRLIECEKLIASEVKGEAEATNRTLESIGVRQSEIRGKLDSLMEHKKKFAEELQTELGMVTEGVREEIKNVGSSLIENNNHISNETKAQVKEIYLEADAKQEERKNEICGLLESNVNNMKSTVEKCSSGLTEIIEELQKQKNALDDLIKRETGKISKTITDKSENIINKETSLLEMYDSLQKEYIKSMINFSEQAEAVLTLLNDSYKHLNNILNVR